MYTFYMSKNLQFGRTESYLQATFATLQWWQQQGRPLQGALIQGSVAQRGMLLPGSDIDLCILTPTEPDPHWFEERCEGSYTVEVYPLTQTALNDINLVLASPALPFNLCEGILVSDPSGILAQLRTRLAPHLCALPFRQKCVTTCFYMAQEAYQHAQEALMAGDLAQTRFQLTVGLWNTIAMVAALMCQCPTNRRGFVLLWQCASLWGRPDVIIRAQQALGSSDLTSQDIQFLANQEERVCPVTCFTLMGTPC